MHASEVANQRLRGMIVSTINFCLFIGVFMCASSLTQVYKTRTYEIDPTQIIGFNGLVCIIFGLLIAVFVHRESPVFLLKKYKEDEAMIDMIRLRSESHETVAIRNEFNEFRVMVNEDSKSSMNLCNYSYAFVVVMILKVIFVCSFNMPLNNYFLELAKLYFYDAENDLTGDVLSGVRCITMLITLFVIDFRRIKLFLISSIGCGIILLACAYKPVSDESIYAVIVAISFQIFAGISIGYMSDIYTVDAVNTRVKPIFIAFTSSLEMLLQILLIVTYFYFDVSNSVLMSIFGFIMLVFGILAHPFFSFLPDTSGLSLRNARNKF
jgi:hypothetical protein